MKKFLKKLVLPLFLIILAAVFETLLRIYKTPKYILPLPSEVVLELIKNYKIYFFNTVYSFTEMLIGFVLACFAALILGSVISYNRILKDLIYPILIITQSIPLVVIAPWILLAFGFGISSKIVVVFIFSLSPILISFIDGLFSIKSSYYILMDAMRVKRRDVFFKMELPMAIPNFMSGMKVSAGYSFAGVITSEWIGGEQGLGIIMQRFFKSFKSDSIMVSSILIVLFGFLFFKFVEHIENKITSWKDGI